MTPIYTLQLRLLNVLKAFIVTGDSLNARCVQMDSYVPQVERLECIMDAPKAVGARMVSRQNACLAHLV